MIIRKNTFYILPLLFFLVITNYAITAQEETGDLTFNNQFSTNLLLPVFESFDLSYERVIANKWAVGLAGAVYGNPIENLSTDQSSNYDTNYEIMPFGRLYFQGAQKKSHFIEVFGSLSWVIDSRSFIRTTNSEGFGVYRKGETEYTVGGLGMGYGYRFLLLDNKLVLEAQFGIRTNFNTNFLILNGALIRTGIKIGYRF